MVRARAVAVGTGRAAGAIYGGLGAGGARGAERGGAGVPETGDYADSGELAEKCNTYIRAQTVGSPFTKYKLYNNLGGFLDSSRQAQAQIPEIYDMALEHYRGKSFQCGNGVAGDHTGL